MCARRSSSSLIPVFTLLSSLGVSVRSISGASGKTDTLWVLQLPCFLISPPPPTFLLSTSYSLCPSHLLQLLSYSHFLATKIGAAAAAAFLSRDRRLVCCQNFRISHYGKLEWLLSCDPCVCLLERERTSCQLRMIFQDACRLLDSLNPPQMHVHVLPVSPRRSSCPLLMECEPIMSGIH